MSSSLTLAPAPPSEAAEEVRTQVREFLAEELADGQARAVGSPGALPGVDVAAGFGALLGLDAPGVRRLVSGAVTSLATVAGDVVAELRQLTRGAEDEEPADDDEEEQAPPDPPSSSPPSSSPPSSAS